ncbi:hypothetical protein ACWGJP_14060 [Microbacterium sp. NPDC055903]
MTAGSRVLIAELDSPAQAERFREGEDARQAITELTGMLRTGMLISGTVLVTDAMVLDGAYFVRLGPDGVLRELGVAGTGEPLVITGTAPTLRAGLEARRENPDFAWSLEGVSYGRVPDSVADAWNRWLHATESGTIRYEQQTAADAPLRTGPAPVASAQTLEIVAESKLGEVLFRSIANRRIDDLSVSEDERARIRSWWTDAYLRMIAENARADWISFDRDPGLRAELDSQDLEVPLPEELRAWAERSTPSTIALGWDASVTQRARLRAAPTWSKMRGLAYAVKQVSAVPARWWVITASASKLVFAVLVIWLAVPGLGVGAVDNPLTWIAFIGLIATTVPVDSLLSLLSLFEKAERTRLIVHRGARA